MQNNTLQKEAQEIYLKLEKYDDIFSDFDIRPYSKRALSSDFLEEIKRATIDKTNEGINLIFHVSENLRNETQEVIIQTRLIEHFNKHQKILTKEKSKVLKMGWSMTFFGFLFMIIATYIMFKNPSEDLVSSFLIVFLEPAAWFLVWEGMEQVIFGSKKSKSDLEFYTKMSDSRGSIVFKTI
jgi:hypothetical protein